MDNTGSDKLAIRTSAAWIRESQKLTLRYDQFMGLFHRIFLEAAHMPCGWVPDTNPELKSFIQYFQFRMMAILQSGLNFRFKNDNS